MKMKNSIFSLNEFIDILTDEYVRNSRKEEYLYRTLTSTSFYGWLFNPPENAKLNIERDKKELYEVLSSSKVLSNILGTIEDYGYDEFPRTAAVFLYSLCNYVVDECNNDSNDVDLAYRSGAITRSKKDESQTKIEKRFERASKINDLLNKMIKHEAKSVWKRCGLNKTTVIEAFKSVPEQAYLKNSDIGYYLNIVNSQLYDSLDEFYELDEIDIERVDWHLFFTSLFGDDNEVQIAMYLCLEGTRRIIKDWKNAKKIREVWDSLTGYALEVLENADATSRSHMLDLYAKIVGTMNSSNSDDLRVDLTKIDEEYFPNIARSVRSIADKLTNLKAEVKESIKNNDKKDKKVTKVS